MNIIEIISSDSEDDVEISPTKSRTKTLVSGAPDLWLIPSERFRDEATALVPQCVLISVEEFTNRVRRNGSEIVPDAGFCRVPELKGSLETNPHSNIECDALSIDEGGVDVGSSLGATQKRALPSSFKPSLGLHGDVVHVPKSKGNLRSGPDNGTRLDQDGVASDGSELDRIVSKPAQKETLPVSSRLSLEKITSEDHKDHRGGDHVHEVNAGCRNDDPDSHVNAGPSLADRKDNVVWKSVSVHENIGANLVDSKLGDSACWKNDDSHNCEGENSASSNVLNEDNTGWKNGDLHIHENVAGESSTGHNVLKEDNVDAKKADALVHENTGASTADSKGSPPITVNSRSDDTRTYKDAWEGATDSKVSEEGDGQEPMEVVDFGESIDFDGHIYQDAVMEEEEIQGRVPKSMESDSQKPQDAVMEDGAVQEEIPARIQKSIKYGSHSSRVVVMEGGAIQEEIPAGDAVASTNVQGSYVPNVFKGAPKEPSLATKTSKERVISKALLGKNQAKCNCNSGANAADRKVSEEDNVVQKIDVFITCEITVKGRGPETDNMDFEERSARRKIADGHIHEITGQNTAGGKIFKEADQGKKNDDAHNYENTSRYRNLPSSFLNGNSVNNSLPQVVGAKKHIFTFDEKSSKSVGPTAANDAHRFLGSSFTNEQTITDIKPKTLLGRISDGMVAFLGKNLPSIGTTKADQKIIMEDDLSRNNHRPHIDENGRQSGVLPSSLQYGIKSHDFVGADVHDCKSFMKDGIGQNGLGVCVDQDSGICMGLGSSSKFGKAVSISESSVYQESKERIIYQEALQSLDQPKLEHDLPDGLLTVSLLKHQKIALAWMVQKESKRFPCCGGILADDQGLGKTVSTIALIQMQRHLQSEFTSGNMHPAKSKAMKLEDADGFTEVGRRTQVRNMDHKRNRAAWISDNLHPIKSEVSDIDDDDDVILDTIIRRKTGKDEFNKKTVVSTLDSLHHIKSRDMNLDDNTGFIRIDEMKHIGENDIIKTLAAKISNNAHLIESDTFGLDEDDDDLTGLDKIKQIGKGDLETRQLAETPDNPSSRRYDTLSTDEGDTVSGVGGIKRSMLVASDKNPAGGTLVVCPASIIPQWAHELNEKVTDSARLSVLVHHGGTRTKDPAVLAKFDVVLTTYAVVSNEVSKNHLVNDNDKEEKNLHNDDLLTKSSTQKKEKKISNSGKRENKKRKRINNPHVCYVDGPLARVHWFRVVLDEAQIIKNHRTHASTACCGLQAKIRWCLSGTPIQNRIDDLYSYFRFLKYDPYSIYSSFHDSIKNPILRDASNGYKKLQAVLRTVLLRRTKGTLIDGEPIVELPPKTICLKKVNFSEEEQAFYSSLEADSHEQFKAYYDAGTIKENFANILVLLLRLRQACDHPCLARGIPLDTKGKCFSIAARKLPREMLTSLLSRLESSLETCGICSESPEDAVVAICGHVFCYHCVSGRINGDDNLCPAASCNDALGFDSIFSESALKSCISSKHGNDTTSSSADDKEKSIEQSSYSSSKIKAAMEILNSICNQSPKVVKHECCGNQCCLDRTYNFISENSFSENNGKSHICAQLNSNSKLPVKAIVFSQWTSMLDLLEISLDRSLIQYRRLDGTMSLKERDKAVKEFGTDSEVKVMLMSLKAGNLGLNMVAACHVILLDPWWNPTSEDQAIDRAHRIGQTRPVTVTQLIVSDSVEDRILTLQEKKRQMVASAFGEDQTNSQSTRLTIDTLRYLFMNAA